MSDANESHTDEYTIRDDQRAAMEELERLQKTRADDWNEEKDAEFLQLLQEPGPDYEETLARLELLNAELEREPSPDESKSRQARVRFSAELVQVAPSPSPPPEETVPEEADAEDAASEESETVPAKAVAPPSPMQQPLRQPVEVDGGGHLKREFESDGGGDKPAAAEKKVLLVSENGQYQYVDRREVEADQDADGSDQSDENEVGESESNGDERPPRPASAAVEPQGSRQQPSGRAQRLPPNGTGRPGSAPSNGCHEERERDNELAFQAWLRAKRAQKRRERREQQDRERRAEAERERTNQHEKENGTGFQAWLRSKYQQDREERERREAEQREREREQQRSRAERPPQPSFDEWMQAKRKQWCLERKYQGKEREELNETVDVHSTKQCRKAFKQWLRRKEEQKRHEELCERQRARITQLALRRSRKSQALANALLVASSYRYMDYYGYR